MPRESSAARVERGPTSGIHPAAKVPDKPLLASEVLRDEVAPFEPGRHAARFWLLGTAAALGLLGFAFRGGVGIPGLQLEAATISFSAAGAVAAVAVLPFPYALRAGTALVLGAALMVMGLRGAGPLAGLSVDGALLRDVARLVAVTVLPAALIFRAKYRAYRPARWVLAGALVLSVPFVVFRLFPLLEPSGPIVSIVAACVSIAVVSCGFFGFMGAATTGAGSVWAALVLLALPAEVALHELTPLAGADTGMLTYPTTAVGLACAAGLTTLGISQLLAAGLARRARRASGGKRESPKRA